MKSPSLPANEQSRLDALRSANLLDSQPEPQFDRITKLAQRYFDVDIVLISLVDEHRQWFKSKQGLDACETGRDISFCGHAILQHETLEVSDATKDPRFSDNPLVTGPPNIRFYAGAQLTHNDFPIGTLCLIHSAVKTLNQEEKDTLREFADLVEQVIDDRLLQAVYQDLKESELRYRSVLEGTRIGTWEWNVQTGETVFNQRWAEIVGYTLKELDPVDINTWLNLAHPEDLKVSGEKLQSHFNGETPFYDYKCRMKHRKGHWVWVHDRGKVVTWTNDGQPLMMYGTHADITEQVNSERALEDSKEQFETLVNNIPGVTYRYSVLENRKLKYLSGSVYELTGYSPEEFMVSETLSPASLVHPDDFKRVRKTIEDALEARTNWVVDYRSLHRNGTIRHVEERGIGEYDETGNLEFIDGFVLDVTKEKELERRLVKLTDQVPGVVYQFQMWPDGRSCFPYASKNIKHIYGVSPEQVRQDASAVFDTILDEDLPKIQASIATSQQNLSIWEIEYRVKLEGGDIKWLSGRAMPEKMIDGSVLWHGYIHDVSDQKRHYLKLEQVNQDLEVAQTRLDLASKTAKIGYWEANLKTGELKWSPMIFDIFGFKESDTKPSVALFQSTVHPDDKHLVAAIEERAKESGIHDVVHRIVRKDGEIRWVHELAELLPEAENPDLVMVGSVQDVTERMQLLKVKDEFIATVSHELRTPLTSIYGALQLLNASESSQLGEKARTLLNVAHSNTTKLLTLINDLLDIEKLVAGKMQFEMRKHSARALLEKSVLDHSTYAEKHSVTLNLEECNTVENLCISVDESRFQQLMANLLSNAIKFSPENGLVRVIIATEDSKLEVAVLDEGPGILEDYKDKIFDRFSQADASDSKAKGGTGLGLALCKELAEGMNGEVGLDDSYTKGARFYVKFPLV
ncbi:MULTISPECIES: PAS domain-containing protein [Gammaproteobacteria]|uniref:PAS domain-containing protein n=1 Tax=Gammaproteobacteria TaxID=1236 RepID=UPI000DCF6577|nr:MULTISPECIES: PAS domain-containing protein [Gammaproteobacteria]RTE86581.1 PAS domain S-box protein [Aliidiomarina sp. B3213]TCZ90864.1 PAS domain S-box protein [Lysobacter sp. N42]